MEYFLSCGIRTKNANTLKNVGRIIDNMNKEITIYELLGLVKDNKAPKRIKCNDLIFVYNESNKDYVCEISNNCWLFTNYIDIGKNISKKVEILEEDKDIEELKIENDNPTHFYIRDEKGTKCGMTKHSKMIAEKVNEVIKAVNELRNEGKENEKNN